MCLILSLQKYWVLSRVYRGRYCDAQCNPINPLIQLCIIYNVHVINLVHYLRSQKEESKSTTWSSLGVNIDLDNLMSSSKPKPTATSSGPSMNQLAQSSTSPAHPSHKTPSTFSSASTGAGPNYNINTTNLMGTPPTSRSMAPGMGVGMGVQPGMAAPGMGMQPGMGMGMNYGGGMGMGYGMGPRPMYGGAGFGAQPPMGYGGGMMGAPGMMNPMGMQQQQRQF